MRSTASTRTSEGVLPRIQNLELVLAPAPSVYNVEFVAEEPYEIANFSSLRPFSR
jgi:hypothetical protein